MTSDDKLGEHLVLDGIDGVLDDAKDVKTRKNGLGELDVLLERNRRVVPASDWIGGGDDGAPGLKRRDDSGFGDGDRLLFHGLMNRGSVLR